MIVIRLSSVDVKQGLQFIDGRPVKITVTGHGGSGTRGNDIVCSAVSALSQTLVLSIERLTVLTQDVEVKNGYLSAVVSPSRDSAQVEKLKLLIESFLIGILEIRKEYPDRVEIDFEVC